MDRWLAPRLESDTFVIAIALFVVAVIGIVIAHGLRFRRRPDRSLQQP